MDQDIVSIVSSFLDQSNVRSVSKDWEKGFNMMMKSWYKKFKTRYPGINRDQNDNQYSTIMTSLHESIIANDKGPLMKLLQYNGYLPINWVSLFWIIYWTFRDDKELMALYREKNKYYDSMVKFITAITNNDILRIGHMSLFYTIPDAGDNFDPSFTVELKRVMEELSFMMILSLQGSVDISLFIGLSINTANQNLTDYFNYLYNRSDQPGFFESEALSEIGEEASIIYGAPSHLNLTNALFFDRVDLLILLNPSESELAKDDNIRSVYKYGYCYDWIKKTYPNIDLSEAKEYLYE